MTPNQEPTSCPLTYEGIIKELASQVRRPMGNDSGIAGFSLAMITAVEDYPTLAEIAVETDLYHYVESPRDVVNQTLRAVQAQAIGRDVTGYPHKYLAPDLSIASVSEVSAHWYDLISEIVSENHSLDELAYDVHFRRMQSMQVERSKAVKLVGLAMENRFGPSPKILDIGTSQMHGPKHLMLGLPFARTHADTSQGSANKEFNQQLTRLWKPSAIDCVDLFFPDDPSNKNWAFANSFYPKELADDHKVAKYRRISEANVPDVAFARADFSADDPDPVYIKQDAHFRVSLGGELNKHDYDIVSTLTTLYQFSPEERRQWLINCKEYLRPDGVIVMSDFAVLREDVNTDHPTDKLDFDVNWTDNYAYRTFVYDNKQPEKGFQEVYRWLNGRCKKVQIVGSAAVRGVLFAPSDND